MPIAYIFYGLALFCLLVGVLFPYERFAHTMISRLERNSGVELNYQELDYAFPAGVKLDRVSVFLPLGTGRIQAYKGDHLAVQVNPLWLFVRKLNLKFQGAGYGGELAGRAHLAVPAQPAAGDYVLQLKDVRIEEVISQFYLRNFKLSGAVTGDADLHLKGPEDFASATGKVAAALREGMVRNIVIKGLDMPDFAFKEIETESVLENGTLQVESFRIDSEIMLAEIEGEVRLTPADVRDSQLNLNARLKPRENDPMNLHSVAALFDKRLDSEGYYPFKIRGTFRYPELI
jgi:type II secretion system protein N